MADLFSNPMGLDGFEFVEFSAPDPTVLDKVFRALGFIAVAKHRSKDVTLYRQGDVNFIVNASRKRADSHSPCGIYRNGCSGRASVAG